MKYLFEALIDDENDDTSIVEALTDAGLKVVDYWLESVPAKCTSLEEAVENS